MGKYCAGLILGICGAFLIGYNLIPSPINFIAGMIGSFILIIGFKMVGES